MIWRGLLKATQNIGSRSAAGMPDPLLSSIVLYVLYCPLFCPLLLFREQFSKFRYIKQIFTEVNLILPSIF